MEMQGDMEKQNRRKEQEYIKGLKRYEQKGIPVYIGRRGLGEDFPDSGGRWILHE